ncbi:50S ribosomal protein L32e [Candidatus Nanohalobium constans]|uniref:Large ribosomal subunit protein eL32 n=1 Tax=Candidatus Nanohalobium constans TaxID=2565781 RepID=A0A5Q0UH67_9ARCH|nr:50S ribosomal protein L32e [Candidatus Nanohalobium constans]QGA80967.1 50S ribosomal protein L32e [Candidatus Nanohalobium constans]
MSSDKFKRQDKHKAGKLSGKSWRNPVGGHSRVRLEEKGAVAKPKVGYRTDKEIRGKHPSGYDEVMVHNTDDLEQINPEEEAARIGGTVGGRKKADILEKADNEDIKVLNRGDQ